MSFYICPAPQSAGEGGSTESLLRADTYLLSIVPSMNGHNEDKESHWGDMGFYKPETAL